MPEHHPRDESHHIQLITTQHLLLHSFFQSDKRLLNGIKVFKINTKRLNKEFSWDDRFIPVQFGGDADDDHDEVIIDNLVVDVDGAIIAHSVNQKLFMLGECDEATTEGGGQPQLPWNSEVVNDITNNIPFLKFIEKGEYIVEVGEGGGIFRTNKNRIYCRLTPETVFEILHDEHGGFCVKKKQEEDGGNDNNNCWIEVFRDQCKTISTFDIVSKLSSYQHGAILLNDGRVFVCGMNTYQQVGMSEYKIPVWTEIDVFYNPNNAEEDNTVPKIANDEKIINVVTAWWKTFFISSYGRVIATGENGYHVLGRSEGENNVLDSINFMYESGNFHSLLPGLVDALSPDEKIGTVLHCSRHYTCFLSQDKKRLFLCGLLDTPSFGEELMQSLLQQQDETIEHVLCGESGIFVVTSKKKVHAIRAKRKYINQILPIIQSAVQFDERMFGKIKFLWEYNTLVVQFQPLSNDLQTFWNNLKARVINSGDISFTFWNNHCN